MLTDALPATTTIPSQWAVAVDTNTVADDWLETFDDPRLDLLVAEALENNPDLRAAAARVEAARQVVVVVGSQLLPKIGGRLGAAANRDEDHSDWGTPTTAYAGVSWEADIWGKLRAQKAAAEASFESVAYEYAWAQESLAATTAKAWFLATTTRQLLRLSARAVDIYSELFELVKVRRAAGKVSDLDVAEAGASLNTAQAQLRTAKRAEAETRRALELLLGRYPSAEIAVATDFPPVPPPVRAGLPLTLLERRPDLLAAQSQVLSAFRREEAARLALLPSFGLRVEGGRLDDSVLSLLRLNPWLFRGRIGISIPIYAGGELRARVKIATAEQQAAVEGYGAAVLIAFNEVENALTNETLLAQTLHYREASVQDRSEAVRISRIQYKAGATDMLSVLQIQADQIAAEGAVIRTRNAQLSNRIQLHLSLGGHW
jgi:NodT family efflux transporter outer membrane factor (OMF) lipoprotein